MFQVCDEGPFSCGWSACAVAPSAPSAERAMRRTVAKRITMVVVVVATLGSLALAVAPAAVARPVPDPPDTSDGPPPISAASFGQTSYPTVYRIATDDPVVFVTIDDGNVHSSSNYDAIRSRGWPVTNFVLPGPLSQDPNYFKTVGTPSDFGDHTVTHRRLPSLSFGEQKSEICGARDAVKSLVGTTPGWFRPPYGEWNAATMQAAAECGYPGVVLWDVTVEGSVITTAGGGIQRGDIILLHYVNDLSVSIAALGARLDQLG